MFFLIQNISISNFVSFNIIICFLAIKMSLNLIKIYDICRENKTLPVQLQNWGLVPQEGIYLCPKCNEPMKLLHFEKQGWYWDCKSEKPIKNQAKKICNTRVSMRTNTFFNNSKLSYFQILGFAHLWSEGHQLRQIKTHLEIGKDHTLVDWSSFCREVIFIFYF